MLDKTDQELLRQLQSNARISNALLAERINLSPTPCLRRVRKLESSGIIKGYVAVVDPAAVGLRVAAFAFVKLEKNTAEKGEAFEKAVALLSQVMECCVVTGIHDYVLRIVANDLNAYERFIKADLATLDGVADIETTIILNQAMSRSVLPL